ncbi:helix-hairpin-helix domain-containing protein [Patescibacteria group bacterium]
MAIKLNTDIACYFRSKAEKLKQKEGEKYYFRAHAYSQAANAIDNLEESLEDMYKRSWIAGMQKIEGIGPRIARDIEGELKKRGIKRK